MEIYSRHLSLSKESAILKKKKFCFNGRQHTFSYNSPKVYIDNHNINSINHIQFIQLAPYIILQNVNNETYKNYIQNGDFYGFGDL